MVDPTPILYDKQFWDWLFLRAGEEKLDESVLRFFNAKKINGREYAHAVILLPCGICSELEIAILPAFESFELGLRHTTTNNVLQMGWWDGGQCHPHALRWDELEKLHHFWSEQADFDIHPSAGFLLLTLFVGHGVDERSHYSERREAIRKHCDRLGIFEVAETESIAAAALMLPSEADYVWTFDDKLGWVFGGEYSCYSLRNRNHTDGSEGRFPFAEWVTIVEQL